MAYTPVNVKEELSKTRAQFVSGAANGMTCVPSDTGIFVWKDNSGNTHDAQDATTQAAAINAAITLTPGTIPQAASAHVLGDSIIKQPTGSEITIGVASGSGGGITKLETVGSNAKVSVMGNCSDNIILDGSDGSITALNMTAGASTAYAISAVGAGGKISAQTGVPWADIASNPIAASGIRTYTVTLADDATLELAGTFGYNGMYFITPTDYSYGNTIQFRILYGGGLTSISADSSWATADTDGKNCAYQSGGPPHAFYLKNRNGISLTYHIVYFG